MIPRSLEKWKQPFVLWVSSYEHYGVVPWTDETAMDWTAFNGR